jgi:hypothetical protein
LKKLGFRQAYNRNKGILKVDMIKRYWKFYAEIEDDGCYLEEEDIFIGTDSEAAAEANRRSDAYERETGRIISNVVMESRGIVIN